MNLPMNFFECDQCHHQFSMAELTFVCPKCQGLLTVTHDPAIFNRHSSSTWQEIFRERKKKYCYPYISGVWDYKEWVLDDLQEENIITLGEGRTPLLEFPKIAKTIDIEQFFIKQCGTSHSGSFKDIGMTVLVSYVRQIILSKKAKIDAIICASSGDTSAALACYAAHGNIPAIVLLPVDRVTRAQLLQPLANGALVLALQTDFDGCMAIIKKLIASNDKKSSFYLANSMNPLRLEGQKTIIMESLLQIQDTQENLPDWVVIPSGNLGNLSAQAMGMELCFKNELISGKKPRILAAQSMQANPLYLSFQKNFREYHKMTAQPTYASAIQIGNPISIHRAIKTLQENDGIVEQANEDEILESARFADKTGLFIDPQTAVGLACIIKARKKGIIGKNDRVLLISTAHALKFIEFKEEKEEKEKEEKGQQHQLPNRLSAQNFQALAPNLNIILETIKKYIDSYSKQINCIGADLSEAQSRSR